jgi:hypothetical protein
MISTYTKDFSWKINDPNSPDFEGIVFQIIKFYDKFSRALRI